MIRTNSLLHHIGKSRARGVENVASEALCYILGRYEPARTVLCALLTVAEIDLPSSLWFETQVRSGDGTQPDIVGTDKGMEVLHIEAKFEASLTERQPSGYLSRLVDYEGTALLILVPEWRATELWEEVCHRAELSPDHSASSRMGGGMYAIRSPSGVWLALMSWHGLLEKLVEISAIEERNHPGMMADVRQLELLCEAMGQERFTSFEKTDLDPEHSHRMRRFLDVLDEVVGRLEEEERVDSRREPGTFYSGYKITFRGIDCRLCYTAYEFKQPPEGSSPIGFQVLGKGGRVDARLRARLEPLIRSSPPILVEDEERVLSRALMPPLGVGRDLVVESLLAQIREVTERLSPEAP